MVPHRIRARAYMLLAAYVVRFSLLQYLNMKLNGIEVEDKVQHPHLLSVKNCFVRGSTIRYVQIPPKDVDVELLQDATRHEHSEKTL